MAVRARVAVVGPPEKADLPFWREAFAGVDYLRLKTSAVYYGFGVPRGNRTPVVIVPGFLGADFYLLEMYFWLMRLGYRPYFSRIGHNAKCPDILTHRLLATVNRAFAETGQPVHIIGHSFGGVLARGVAFRKPERVASVTMMGSPFGGTQVSRWILGMISHVKRYTHKVHARNKDCFSVDCHCGFACTMRDTFPHYIPQTAIYTKSDGVVAWGSCITGNADDDVEVGGTHIGLAWNPEVYKVIAKRLHEANEQITMRRIEGTIAGAPSTRAEFEAIQQDRAARPRRIVAAKKAKAPAPRRSRAGNTDRAA